MLSTSEKSGIHREPILVKSQSADPYGGELVMGLWVYGGELIIGVRIYGGELLIGLWV
jgi:hypothetical protein